ncbi:MAG: winged helix-turn-helix domain-containing protein [Candidatus Puniceispirillales bacterium]
MENKLSILIYEKEKHLNSILYQQILDTVDYEPYSVHDQIKLIELVNKKTFDICILNIDNIVSKSHNFFVNLLDKNRNVNIIGYHDELINYHTPNNLKIILLKKPFRFSILLDKLDDIKLIKNENKKIILMKHIEYLPNKKILTNLVTETTLHLTEKENSLLNYLYNNRHLKLTKNNLLNDIWGIKKDVNTHTLETHMYRLKQKLSKLEPNLSFFLINEDGLYSLKIYK